MSFMNRFFQGLNKKKALSWALFDFANSSYSLLIITFVFPLFYKQVVVGAESGDFYWGLITSLSILIGGLMAPVIGAIADYDKRKKAKWMFFTWASILGTALLFFADNGAILYASLVFIATNICFELCAVFYDSFLPEVSTEKTVGRISGIGWGFGYLGGVVAMLLFRPFYSGGFEGALLSSYKLTFLFTALFFFVFSIPAFLFISDQSHLAPKRHHWLHLASQGFKATFATLKDIRKHKKIALFLLGFYFMNDALVTLFSFISIFGMTTLGLTVAQIGMLLLTIQLVAFPSATILGLWSDSHGHRRVLLYTLSIWMFIVVGLALAQNQLHFWILGVMSGFVVGSCQAIARSWLSSIIPLEKRNEFFGFNGFASKVSATTGPVLFGTVSVLTGSQRIAMLCLLPFFIAAFTIFYRMKE